MQNLIFRFLQSRQKVQIWLYEQTDLRIEGRIIVRPITARSQKQWQLLQGCRMDASGVVLSVASMLLTVRKAELLRQYLSGPPSALDHGGDDGFHRNYGPFVQGFDEYMNLVLDEAEEVSLKRQTRKPVGARTYHAKHVLTTVVNGIRIPMVPLCNL